MKWSNFHITVNFNIDDDRLVPGMRRAIEAMAEYPYVWWWLKYFNRDRREQEDFEGDKRFDISMIRRRVAFEHAGKRNKGLHAHILIEIEHDSMVQISKQGITELFSHFVKGNPHIHIRFMPGDGEDKDFILKYITKEIPSYSAQNPWNNRLKYAFRNDAGGEEFEDAPPAV